MSPEIVKCSKCDEEYNLSKEKCCDCYIQVYDDDVLINGRSRTAYAEHTFGFFDGNKVMTLTDTHCELGNWVCHNGVICDDCILELSDENMLVVIHYPHD